MPASETGRQSRRILHLAALGSFQKRQGFQRRQRYRAECTEISWRAAFRFRHSASSPWCRPSRAALCRTAALSPRSINRPRKAVYHKIGQLARWSICAWVRMKSMSAGLTGQPQLRICQVPAQARSQYDVFPQASSNVDEPVTSRAAQKSKFHKIAPIFFIVALIISFLGRGGRNFGL